MKTEMLAQHSELETFLKVKDVLESQFLKKLRISKIYKALKLNLMHDKKVTIKYACDQEENREILADIQEVSENEIHLSNENCIPIHAIREIKF